MSRADAAGRRAQHGAFFMMDADGSDAGAQADVARYALPRAQERRQPLPPRRGPGRAVRAREEDASCSRDVPGGLHPDQLRAWARRRRCNIIVLPVLFEGEVKAVIELASFHPFSAIHQIFLDQLMESIGVVLNMISANMRTEELLQQSQSLTQELQIAVEGAHRSSRTSSSAPTPRSRRRRWSSRRRRRLLAEQNTQGRGQEPRGRAGARLARGEGRAARAHLQVQVASSSPTCRTSCARRSTACSSWPSCSPTTRTGTSPTSRSSTRRRSTPRAATC